MSAETIHGCPSRFLVSLFLTLAVLAFGAAPDPVLAADPPPELCNGKDDDGDGEIDEGFDVGDECSVAEPNGCVTAGEKVCTQDEQGTECERNGPPVVASPEVLGQPSCFDGFDNDCDSLIDFDDADCKTVNEIGLCNGLDDDHDGETDEEFLPDLGTTCTAGIGFCEQEGENVCTEDMLATECNAFPGLASTENTPGVLKCVDGIDNDCDALTDLADPGCQTAEVCDGQDNDGDGFVDEDFADLGSTCSEGIGACLSDGKRVCDQDGSATLCNAIPLPAGVEGPSGSTCSDGVDNDCDGSTDLDDTDCASAELVASCALVPAKPIGGGARRRFRELSADCDGTFIAQAAVNSSTAQVTIEAMGMEADGTLIGSLPVQDGDWLRLGSRTHPQDYSIGERNGAYEVFAPVPMLRVVADAGQHSTEAYCAPIPYLRVIEPAQSVVTLSEGDVLDVVAIVNRADSASLFVKIDGQDVLGLLGLDPATAFPGGPYGGVIEIGGQEVTIEGLSLETAPLDTLGTNTFTMRVHNLGGGGHAFVVSADPLDGVIPRQARDKCLLDDMHDIATSAGLQVLITTPEEEETTFEIPTPVIGEIRHGRQILAAEINGMALDVAGQQLIPGHGGNRADSYVLPFEVSLPQSDLSQAPQPGTLDRGQNALTVRAEDDQGNLGYAIRRFSVGSTVPPGVPAVASQALAGDLERIVSDAEQEAERAVAEALALDNALVIGLSPDALNTFFQSVCDSAGEKIKTKISDSIGNADFPKEKIEVDIACDPTVRFEPLDVSFEGALSCAVTPELGNVNVDIALPTVTVALAVNGQCRHTVAGVCLSEVIVYFYLGARVTDTGISFDIDEILAREGGTSPADYIDGTVDIGVLDADVELNCFSGFLEDVLEFFTFGLVDLESALGNTIEEKVSRSIDISEQLRSASDDPLEVKKFELDRSSPLASGIDVDQELLDVEITPDGLTAAISLSFGVQRTDPDIEGTPAAASTPTPAPMLPVSGAEDAFSVYSDDAFNLMFAAMTARGALGSDCLASELTIADLLPADCTALIGNNDQQTERLQGSCHGAKGSDCGSLPFLQRSSCETTRKSLTNANISTYTPLLFCARQGLGPRLLIEDNPSTADIEARLRLNDVKVTLALDKDGDGDLQQLLGATPNCFTIGADTTRDCKWAAACFDLDVATLLSLGVSGEGNPQVIPSVEGVLGTPEGVQCAGAIDLGGDRDLLSQAGISDPIDVIEENIDSLTPLFQTEGLDLGGFVQFASPELIAIDTAVEADCTSCQEYIGVTGSINP